MSEEEIQRSPEEVLVESFNGSISRMSKSLGLIRDRQSAAISSVSFFTEQQFASDELELQELSNELNLAQQELLMADIDAQKYSVLADKLSRLSALHDYVKARLRYLRLESLWNLLSTLELIELRQADLNSGLLDPRSFVIGAINVHHLLSTQIMELAKGFKKDGDVPTEIQGYYNNLLKSVVPKYLDTANQYLTKLEKLKKQAQSVEYDSITSEIEILVPVVSELNKEILRPLPNLVQRTADGGKSADGIEAQLARINQLIAEARRFDLATLSDDFELLTALENFIEDNYLSRASERVTVLSGLAESDRRELLKQKLEEIERSLGVLVRMIDVVEKDVDLDNILPHSRLPGAKSQSELEVISQDLRDAHRHFVGTALASSGPIDQFGGEVEQRILQVVGSDRNGGRYSGAINKITAAIKRSRESLPLTEEQQQVDKVRADIRRLFLERGVPILQEGEVANAYLRRIHGRLIQIMTETAYNVIYDKKSAAYTNDFNLNPLFGPLKSMDINNHPQSYDESPGNQARNFGALFDQLGYLFDGQADKKEANEFGQRMKDLARELSVWHNRGAIRRSHESKLGPDKSFEALGVFFQGQEKPDLQRLFVNKSELLPEELRFREAVEFSISVWSVMALKMPEKHRLWPLIDPRIKNTFFTNQKLLKNEYDVLPRYRGTNSGQLALINKIVGIIETSGMSRKEAELAYHFGECYRIGAGMEPIFDVSYEYEYVKDAQGNNTNQVVFDRGVPKTKKVSVSAQEGEPKSMSIGLYVDSAVANTRRPDFNRMFGEYMVHGYPSYSRAAQFTHRCMHNGRPIDLSGLGDMRSSLDEIFAAKGAIWTVDWNSRSSDPDKEVYDAASQSTQFFWPLAQKAKAVEDAKSHFGIDVRQIPLAPTQMLDQPEENARLRQYFGWSGDASEKLTRLLTKVFAPFVSGVEAAEIYGFDSDSEPIAGKQLEVYKSFLKDRRDYWTYAFFADAEKYPMDSIRMLTWLFSRDDKQGGFVNSKIADIVKSADTFRRNNPQFGNKELSKFVKKRVLNQLSGYITFDFLMRSVFYLLKPDFRSVRNRDDLTDPHKLDELYEELNAHNVEEYMTKTYGGQRLVNVAQLMFVINQFVLLRDAVPEDRDDMYAAGYRLYTDSQSANGVPFSRFDLLRMAQNDFGLGEGYEFKLVKNGAHEAFYQLTRKKGHKTLQMFVDRVMLLQYLFKPHELGLTGGGKH